MFEGDLSFISKAPEFPTDFEWINTAEPLSLSKLRGHVVVLDFWTYCCINCMHTLPILSELEKKYSSKPVVFIGVHSGKFVAEQQAKNVENAVQRYEIRHPVVVDQKMTIWNKFEVNGWPTIVIVDPNGTIIYKQAGEGQKELIDDTIQVLLERHSAKGTIAKEPVNIRQKPKLTNRTYLSFPGKLSISGQNIAISDSNHNRILVTDLKGKMIHTVGTGQADFLDGDFGSARFFRPQGVLLQGDVLYVADTENHAVRMVDLKRESVTTIAGTGKQCSWMSPGGPGVQTDISSPWDLAKKDNKLYIAMAGNHQIWSYDTDLQLIVPFAGTGMEGIVDGNIKDAQLAQPSGVTVYDDHLYFTDSETSSIRKINLETNDLTTIAGRGLFEFGHKDGHVTQALFQHPLGLDVYANTIFVADTYNSAIRIIDLKTSQVSTLIARTGDGKVCKPDDPSCNILPLYEPSDVKFFDNYLFMADTNNHLLRKFDLNTNMLEDVEIL